MHYGQMAISLYRTMSIVKTDPSGQNLLMLVIRFLETFFGSMSAGVGDWISTSRYMLAEGLGLSGIVSILFTGIVVMKHYSYSNLSQSLYTWALILLWSSIAGHVLDLYSSQLLRGAMAFALALQSVHDLPEGHGQTILTATTTIVVLTVLLIGGSTGTMLEALEVVGGDNHHDSPLSSLGTITFLVCSFTLKFVLLCNTNHCIEDEWPNMI
ncbi:hypothetical protein RIF29_25145 [Crotalaria pallida]|uniref:Uncharacterized protein n=1 Tax=Crotalaria pallida TaxID=3830 RepID=A0AAN9ELS8_CROPI